MEASTQAAGQHLMMFFGQSAIPDGDVLIYDQAQDSVSYGGQFTLDDAAHDALVTNPYISPYVREVTTDYSQMTRAELEQAASDAGIPNPDDLEAYPANGSLAAAIENANMAAAVPPVTTISAADQQTGAGPFAVEAQEAPAEPTPEEGDE
jgi:hypothetical protein